jgi:hypothetical protein
MQTTRKFAPPPRTLAAVAAYVADGAMPYASAMKEFIDHVIRHLQTEGACREDRPLPIDAAMVEQEPPVIGDPVLDVHLGGMAEHLAQLGGFRVPDWTRAPERFLVEPKGAGVGTPEAFVRRGLLCGPALKKVWAVLPERNCAPSRCTI